MVTFVAVHPSLHTPTKVQHGLAPPTTHPGASLKGLGTHGPVVAGGSGALSSMYMYSSEVASVDATNTTLDSFRAHHSSIWAGSARHIPNDFPRLAGSARFAR